MKKFLLLALAIIMVIGLVACGEKESNQPQNQTEVKPTEVAKTTTQETEATSVPKREQEGTAGSNIPLKDNLEEAERQIKMAMQDLLVEAYGEKVFDARFYVEKMYTTEEEQEVEALKEANLGPNEVAFEVRYEIRPAEGVDPMEFTAGTGEYDEESGWVKEKYNLGILRPKADGEGYEITNFGTGW